MEIKFEINYDKEKKYYYTEYKNKKVIGKSKEEVVKKVSDIIVKNKLNSVFKSVSKNFKIKL